MKKLLDLLFPPRCAVCGEVLTIEERNGYLCKSCAADIPYFPRGKCPHCGSTTDNGGFCESCLKQFAFAGACSAFPYETVRTAIHFYKYDGGKEIGRGLGELMADYLLKYHEELLVQTDIILSVPLHKKKEKQRGFNQTHILCEKISEKTGLPFQKDGLERKRETVAQSMLTPEERKINLKDAFGVTADFSGKRILLVDDIFTTGTTCNECAKELYRGGASAVRVFTLSAAGTE